MAVSTPLFFNLDCLWLGLSNDLENQVLSSLSDGQVDKVLSDLGGYLLHRLWDNHMKTTVKV